MARFVVSFVRWRRLCAPEVVSACARMRARGASRAAILRRRWSAAEHHARPRRARRGWVVFRVSARGSAPGSQVPLAGCPAFGFGRNEQLETRFGPKNVGRNQLARSIGPTVGPGVGPGVAFGLDPGGAVIGLGVGLGAGAGVGPGAGPGLGAGVGPGVVPGVGAGVDLGFGPGVGPGVSLGAGPGVGWR